MNRIEELQRLIAQSDEKIKKKMSEISEINRKIKVKQDEIRTAENELNKKSLPKILTQKQKRELEKEKKRKQFLEKQKIRETFEQETEKCFEKADILRKSAANSSEKEKLQAEISATELEITALEREYNIRHEIITEKDIYSKELLADKFLENIKSKQENTGNHLKLSRKKKKFINNLCNVDNKFSKECLNCLKELELSKIKLLNTRYEILKKRKKISK
ncbi:MAG: hypothetical protein Q4B84_02475 [Clostridia bacterium]|nr:hypothetical protein [Clostridia bacterium]